MRARTTPYLLRVQEPRLKYIRAGTRTTSMHRAWRAPWACPWLSRGMEGHVLPRFRSAFGDPDGLGWTHVGADKEPLWRSHADGRMLAPLCVARQQSRMCPSKASSAWSCSSRSARHAASENDPACAPAPPLDRRRRGTLPPKITWRHASSSIFGRNQTRRPVVLLACTRSMLTTATTSRSRR